MGQARRRHAERVGQLLWEWSGALGHDPEQRLRWRAAGILHDALKGASPGRLRANLCAAGHPAADPEDWPDPLLHGPACAHRLWADGVRDSSLLAAITHHTTGHPGLTVLGEALYLADFLEPGRTSHRQERAAWRDRMPAEWHAVLREVAEAKIGTLRERGIRVPRRSEDFLRRVMAPRS